MDINQGAAENLTGTEGKEMKEREGENKGKKNERERERVNEKKNPDKKGQ